MIKINKYIQSTKEGRLHISSRDFFKQKKVRSIIKSFKGSAIDKEIKKNKKHLYG